MKKAKAKAYADELDHLYQGEAVDEGILRAQDAVEARQTPEAQSWLSAVFILARRLRSSGK